MTSLETQQPLTFEQTADRPVAVAGNKAHTLARLDRRGFNVPSGVVFPSPWVETADHDELRSAVQVVLDRLDGPYAVRSSARAEDTGERSFAGQYETVLSVESADDLVHAIRRVVASARSERIAAYGRGEAGIAVLVQEMIDPAAAGVAFTADPVSGERGVTIVSAVEGLAERLVSGDADPDEWEVRDGQVSERRLPEASLTREQVLEVANLARRVADALDTDQDIEWAIDGHGTLHLLQARPITGLGDVEPIEPEIEAPEEGFWTLDGGHYPSPISPMAASFYLPVLQDSATAAFRRAGVLLERIENRAIGWRVYVRMVPVGGKEGGPTPPAWLMGVLARVVPPIREQARKARDLFDSGRIDDLIDRWWNEWRPQFKAEIEELGSVQLETLDDDALLDHLDRVLDLVSRGQEVHFELFPPYMVGVAEMVQFCQERLGWTKTRATELLAGLSSMSSEPARRLRELGRLARSRPDTARLLEGDGDVELETLRESDEEFATALDAYLDEFGVRASAYDVLAPTLGEQTDVLVSTIREEASYDPVEVEREQKRAREEAVREARDGLSGDQRNLARFEDLLRRVQDAYPVREDNIFFTDNAPLGLVRLTALETGRRLEYRRQLDDAGHVFFLTIDEARKCLRDGTDLRDLVERRRGEREWALRNAPPPSFGDDPGPPPDMSAMPEGVRRLMGAIAFFMENDLAADTGDGLSGTPASPGSHTGTARVILNESDFHRVRQGDVLVCPITTPSWSILFGHIGGLVTDTGGLLSHSAIVAREHGIPAVVATGSATTAIPDGATVTVDGTTGKIDLRS